MVKFTLILVAGIHVTEVSSKFLILGAGCDNSSSFYASLRGLETGLQFDSLQQSYNDHRITYLAGWTARRGQTLLVH
jgi:hypothetical protein